MGKAKPQHSLNQTFVSKKHEAYSQKYLMKSKIKCADTYVKRTLSERRENVNMYRLVCGKYEGFDYADGLEVGGFVSGSALHTAITALRGEGYRIFIVYENAEVVARVDDFASLHNGLMALK